MTNIELSRISNRYSPSTIDFTTLSHHALLYTPVECPQVSLEHELSNSAHLLITHQDISMRGHFDYEVFEMPPFPPHFGHWDQGFGPNGRSRPSFGMHGPHFDRHGCGPHGPPGFDHSPERHGPNHFATGHRGSFPPPPHVGGFNGPQGWHGPPGYDHHDSQACGRRGPPEDDSARCSHRGTHGEHHGSPGCERRGRPEGHYGKSHHDRHGSPGCRRHRSPGNRYNSPECGRRGPPDHDYECHRRGPRDHSPRCGSSKRGPHGFGPGHHGFGPGHHGFGPGPCPRDFFNWPGFGPHRHFGPTFGHRRPGPYERSESPSKDCRGCRKERCCSGKRNNEKSQGNESRRKENGPCGAKNTDQNTSGETVLVQRIIVDRAPTRPCSV